MNTTSFDPTQHPRGTTGQFTEKLAADPGDIDLGDSRGVTSVYCAECGNYFDDNDSRPICRTCDDDPGVSDLYPATSGDQKPRWERVTGRDDTRVGDRVGAYCMGVGVPNYLLGATGTVVATNGPINAKVEFRGPLYNDEGHLVVGDGQVVTHTYPYQLLLREPRNPEPVPFERPPGCSCAVNGDGTVTTMMCPLHADVDPCYTMARVTGKRRTGTIRNGRCTHCGHRS